ncbi:peptide chain release factor N(5)-glutamine methyltransferase [Apilactobacillus bombintestini]|uniref:Release factor glutamine methyltransferase n=1 Tax=Apilactobacillus bombintestini TaxID=2419772 RepID=A0A387AS65_9LACO|nr:peptide chain release factor N(5)-glutamine methyltransferase [Apilactobacillus bombintestini]AYF92813.1 peptide chain release factor N(5)-glutamine methyltransferase [Apilactobacillus bombintestini]
MNKITFFEAQKRASLFIQEKNLDSNMAKFFMTELFGWDNTHLLLHYRDVMSDDDQRKYFDAVDKFIQGQPAQYIVGETYFYGNRFKVDSRVLIPRPETEELVEWLLKDYAHVDNLKVLDLGTGSGAIAVSLKKEKPNWNITASDISSDALEVAKINNDANKTDVKFVLSDLFENVNDDFDVIISNPPYVADDEIKYMDESVLKYEPKQALFAKNNGLMMYQKIAKYIRMRAGERHGALYLEIGFKQSHDVEKIFSELLPEAEVISRNDFFGNPRMIKVNY